MTITSTEAADVCRYLKNLIDLHREMLDGRADEPMADRIRYEMEELWYTFDAPTHTLLDTVSEALHTHAESY